MNRIALAALLFGIGWAASAQRTPAVPPAPPAQTPIIRTQVTRVLVPVVVRDAHGHSVGGLQKDDFILLDEGKPREILEFSAEIRQIQTDADAPSATPAPPAKPSEPAPAKPAEPAPAAARNDARFVAYLFDDLHTESNPLSILRDAARAQLKSLGPADRAAVFTTSGQTTQDFTTDHALLDRAISRIRYRPLDTFSAGNTCPDISYFEAYLIVKKQDQDALKEVRYDAANCLQVEVGDRMVGMAVDAAVKRVLSYGEQAARSALGVLRDLFQRMASLPGEKVVVLASPGFPTADLESYKSDLFDRAVHANIIVNSLDARGLDTPNGAMDASRGMYVNPMNLKSRYDADSHLFQRAFLGEVAAGTGGSFFQYSNDMKGAFEKFATAPAYSYVLSFAPADVQPNSPFRELKVELRNGKGLSITARKGYFPPAAPIVGLGQQVEKALRSNAEVQDFPMEVRARASRSASGAAQLTVSVRIDANGIPFQRTEGMNQNSITLSFEILDSEGKVVSRTDKLLKLNFTDDMLAQAKVGGLPATVNLPVEPGLYKVRVVARESAGQRVAARTSAPEGRF